MASNRELRTEIASLSAELGEGVSTDGLNNAKLTELVETLRAKKALQAASPLGGAVRRATGDKSPAGSEESVPGDASDGAAAPEADTGAQDSAPEPEVPKVANGTGGAEKAPPVVDKDTSEAAPSKGGYVVAPGKAIVTRKGVRAEGARVTEGEFAHGPESIRYLASKGYLVRA